MLLQATSLLLLVMPLVQSQKKSTYTYMVLVPRNIRPGMDLSIPVHFSKPVLGERVTAKLIQNKRTRDGKETETVLSEAFVIITKGGSDAIIRLPIPLDISWGSYNLNVSGSGPVSFHNSTSVYGRPKSLAIFVQTDKAMYKPGETVQYRVFAVDSKLSMIDPLMNIEILDPKGNKIAEHMGVKEKLGFEGSLQLSKLPPIGRWRINVHANETDEKEGYNFEVKEYVLPKFEVTVELDPYGKKTDAYLKGTVKAAYTFGDAVGGSVVLTISKRYGAGFFNAKAVRTDLTLVNGESSFSVPMALLERITRNIDYETFRVHANVTETITGSTLEGEGEIRYYRNPYKIEFFPNMPNNFKSVFGPYKVLVRVLQQDDSPPELTAGGGKLKITVSYFTDQKCTVTFPDRVTFDNYTVVSPFIGGEVILKTTKFYTIAPDGTVKFELQIPQHTATFTIEAEYSGVTTYKEVRRFRSPTNSFFRSEIRNNVTANPLKIGDIVTIEVKSNIKLATAKWVVLSRGQLVESGTVIIGGKPSVGEVQFTLTRAMTPTARFVVYYVKKDDEVVADGLNFAVEEIFENKVTIRFVQPSPQKPKALVDLRVTADADSLVNVLAVDQSVKLLAEGNDITTDRVKDEMNQFGDSPWILRGWGPITPWSFPADDVHDIFDNAQLRILTDADVYRFDLWRLRQANTRSRTASFASENMMDDSAGAGGIGAPSAIGQIRKDFPETWIWKSAVASGGVATFSQLKVPDTITKFVASAFALNLKTGLGVAPNTADLTVRLPLFVKLQLPYSVIRNEYAVIQANIFNNLGQDHNVKVTLFESEDFVGITINSQNTVTEVPGNITKCVLVKKGQPTPVYFHIKPKKVKKDMKLIVRADISTPISRFDEVHRDLIVKAEGIEKEKNTPILVSFQTNNAVVETRNLVYPTELVPDSEFTRVTVFGDVFGLSLENIDNLIRMPYGCGEQNMINFAPAVFAAAYMRKTGRFDNNKKLMDKIKNVLMTGYQRQLIYQRSDGSFSAFGDADSVGSLWLTAFVIKSFAQAHSLGIVLIDNKVVERAVRFIMKNQNPDGTINNVGILSHRALQGSAAGDRAMLAYVLVALQEVKNAEILKDQDVIKQMNDAIVLLTSALVLKVPQMTTDYEKAIGAYALKLVNNGGSTTLLNGLENSVNKVEVPGQTKHWNNPSRALEIEIAAYALLTYSKLADKTNGLMILKWLIENRNPYGGFLSTQDTVVALQSFTEFAALIYSKEVSMVIDICKDTCAIPANKKQIILNNQNHDILQFVEFEGKIGRIIVDVKGIGFALIDINQFFNVKSETSPSYDLTITVPAATATAKKYTIKACARYKGINTNSNMAIMNFGAVSGFKPDKDKVIKTPIMKRLELEGGRLFIYFDQIPKKEICVSVPYQRVSFVGGVQASNVILYSYYEPDEKIMKNYLPSILEDKNTPLCKACNNCCSTENLLPDSAC
ncbi:alpha-2-macroglobulin-like isoform X2 [Mercenaria mercenaria]|uniref:alpha-2-macroglobulin-like isoform X2 n=1 Tax=Mercenaria mercenaria TaxID=6596 RepID=UPI00234E51B5|nr:alpha-2-macroglobulin-like isoform X2 [Mercenaria mercenaria]